MKKAFDKDQTLAITNRPESALAEQFRTLRTNIQFSMVDQDLKSIVITSARVGAGKSFVAANLAATFTSEDFKVLLVDGDLRRPAVHKMFSLKNHEGLTTLLRDKSEKLEDTIHKIAIEELSLHVLTSGPIPPNPANIVGSNTMKLLQQEMEEQYDLVIFDTPPILPIADALIFTSNVDGTVFVIPEASVTKDELLKSKELLELARANVVGAVFNQVEKQAGDYYYGEDM